jgi:putative copper export protein
MAGGPSAVDVVAWAARWLMLAGITISLGAVSCRLLLGLAGQPYEPLPDRARRCASLGMWAALVLLPAALARLGTEVMDLADPGQSWSDWGHLLMAMAAHTHWGTMWFVQVAIAVAAAIAFAIARSGRRWAWTAAGIAALGLAAAPALAGHAASVEQHHLLVMTADMLHVIGAGTWMGTLTVLAAVTLRGGTPTPRRRAPEEWGADIAGLVRAFSPVALTSAAILAITGTIAAWNHLDTVSSLWRSGYGRTLLVKLALVGLVLLAGAYNWQRGTPRLTAPGQDGVRAFTRSVSVEIGFGMLVLAVTAILVAMPLPMAMAMPMGQ